MSRFYFLSIELFHRNCISSQNGQSIQKGLSIPSKLSIETVDSIGLSSRNGLSIQNGLSIPSKLSVEETDYPVKGE